MDCSTNSFTSSLFSHILQTTEAGENIFLSPLSVSTALSMLLLGCGGSSKEQLMQGLHLQSDSDIHRQISKFLKSTGASSDSDIHRQISKFLKRTGASSADKVLLSNLIFIHEQMLPTSFTDNKFVKAVKKFYQSDVQAVDFGKDGSTVMKKANDWVSNATNGMIQEILTNPPDCDTRMILLNAIYFKGMWKRPFHQSSSIDAPFYDLVHDQPTETRFMTADERTELYAQSVIGKDIPVHVLDLPYSSDCSMRFVVPIYRDGKPGELLGESLKTPGSLVSERQLMELITLETRRKSDLEIVLPIFKFEAEYTMNDHLKSLGITDIFDSGKADFTGITPSAIPGSNLCISEVKHKAVVDVNEKGTKAAAVTVTRLMYASVSLSPPPTEIRGDRPFLFFIRKGKLVLFAGLYASVPAK